MHTGQHYDDSLSAVFFRELGLARPERELGIGGGSNTSQLARMLARAGAAARAGAPRRGAGLRRHQLDARGRARRGAGGRARWCTSRRGCARSTARCPRSATACSPTTSPSCCCAPRTTAAENLRAESIAGRVEVVGDVMVDVALRLQPAARADTGALRAHGVRAGAYLLLTAHRAGNVDDPARLRALVELVRALPDAGGVPAASAHARASARRGAAGGADADRGPARQRAARLRRAGRAAVQRPRGADRLRWRPEGGVPCGGALHHAARQHRVGRDRGGRLEHARGPRRRRRARGARAPPPSERRSCTATATRPSAACRRSVRSLGWPRERRHAAVGGHGGPPPSAGAQRARTIR